MEPNHVNTPSGNPTDVFPKKKKAFDKYASDLRNFAFSRDQAIKRNKFYIVLIAICVLAMVFTVCTMSFKTYVVRVDNATGAVDTGGELKTTNYTPHHLYNLLPHNTKLLHLPKLYPHKSLYWK